MNVEIDERNFIEVNGKKIRYGILDEKWLDKNKFTIFATSSLDYSHYVLRKRKEYQEFKKYLEEFDVESVYFSDFIELYENAKFHGICDYVSRKFIKLERKLKLLSDEHLYINRDLVFAINRERIRTPLVSTTIFLVKKLFNEKKLRRLEKQIIYIGKKVFAEFCEMVNYCLKTDDYCSEDFSEPSDLIGDWKIKNTEYIPDQNGKHGYSAVIDEGRVIVVWSKKTKKCNLHKHFRFSNAGDLSQPEETEGYLTFELPNELLKEESEMTLE